MAAGPKKKRFFIVDVWLWSLILTVVMMGAGMVFSENFYVIISKPDNIPIAGMLIVVLFFTWWGFKQAVQNDEHSKDGERWKIYEDMIR